MSKVVKRLLLIVPMVTCLFAFGGSDQEAKANETIKKSPRPTVNNTAKLTNSFLNEQNNGDSNRIGLNYHNDFGVEIGGCYYQVEQTFDGYGALLCGTLIVFCEDSVEIYTGGTSCS
ncbi:MAG: hypothetical protein FD167_580 [bacterium]|nr:MAG: hypothetical protein FD167_580 [bacterium]